ncbi:MAG: hypothetical protein ACOCXJ_05610 [Planctomycetota bacterium]
MNTGECARRWDAFWQGELYGRPPVVLSVPREAHAPGPPHYRLRCTDAQAAAGQAQRYLQGRQWLGDARPAVQADLGPDQYAAFYGGQLRFAAQQDHTNWIDPFLPELPDAVTLQEDGALAQLERVLRTFRADAVRAGVPDLHSNLDALSAMRGPDALAMDLYDEPELIRRIGRQLADDYPRIYMRLEQAADWPTTGYSGWLPLWSRRRYAVTQCDFSCMISCDCFDDFVLPLLQAEWAFLADSVYHLDGVGALHHLPRLLEQERLHCIQWVPGAGQEPVYAWDDLLLRIQAAGKAVIVSAPPEQVERLHGVLDPALVCYETSCADRDQAERLLERLERAPR